MTREQLDETFTKYYHELVRAARRLYTIPDEAEDIINSVYIRAATGREYEKVMEGRIRKWWHFKVRGWIDEHKTRNNKVKQAEIQFHADCGESVFMEMTEEAGKALVEGEWWAMTRLQRSRLRAKYQKEGIPLLPFMEPYTKQERVRSRAVKARSQHEPPTLR